MRLVDGSLRLFPSYVSTVGLLPGDRKALLMAAWICCFYLTITPEETKLYYRYCN